jgi:hypothetical protein
VTKHLTLQLSLYVGYACIFIYLLFIAPRRACLCIA